MKWVMCLFSATSTAVVAIFVFLLESYVSQKTLLEVAVSNPCVCGQLGVTGILHMLQEEEG